MSKHLVGSDFYKSKGYKTIAIHIKPNIHKKLKQLAKNDGRSIQKTVERLIEERITAVNL